MISLLCQRASWQNMVISYLVRASLPKVKSAKTSHQNMELETHTQMATWNFNALKTKFMAFSMNRNKPAMYPEAIFIPNLTVKWVEYFELLGVKFDSKPSLRSDIRNLLAELERAMTISYKLGYLVNCEWIPQLYNTYFICHMDYCCSIWAVASKSSLDQISISQHKAIKIIHNLPYQTSVSQYFKHDIIYISTIMLTSCLMLYSIRGSFNKIGNPPSLVYANFEWNATNESFKMLNTVQ